MDIENAIFYSMNDLSRSIYSSGVEASVSTPVARLFNGNLILSTTEFPDKNENMLNQIQDYLGEELAKILLLWNQTAMWLKKKKCLFHACKQLRK